MLQCFYCPFSHDKTWAFCHHIPADTKMEIIVGDVLVLCRHQMYSLLSATDVKLDSESNSLPER